MPEAYPWLCRYKALRAFRCAPLFATSKQRAACRPVVLIQPDGTRSGEKRPKGTPRTAPFARGRRTQRRISASESLVLRLQVQAPTSIALRDIESAQASYAPLTSECVKSALSGIPTRSSASLPPDSLSITQIAAVGKSPSSLSMCNVSMIAPLTLRLRSGRTADRSMERLRHIDTYHRSLAACA